MKLTTQQLAAARNAKAAQEFADSYLTTLGNTLTAQMDSVWGADIDTAFFFAQLETDAARIWAEHGERLSKYMAAFIRDRMRQGDTLEAATLAAWVAVPKPAKIVAFLPDGSARVTTTVFPTALPITVWSVPVADETALAALVAGGDVAVLAALTAAQP